MDSPGNTLRHLIVNDTFGTALAGGILLTRSDENDISHSEVARSFCVGISLDDSSS